MDSGMNDTLNSDYMTFITKASRHFSDEPSRMVAERRCAGECKRQKTLTLVIPLCVNVICTSVQACRHISKNTFLIAVTRSGRV